ncbi:3-oxoacyl-[acyl-carrier-protein] reductase FabG (plasmid) [Pseudoalteromonas sp. THAF3]|uniref:3-oxoacyl-ACP reductase FabG n=1 Tax=Pseudoalteromonas ruthenica TaxID=151081 RepID=A0A5S3Z5E8_9GAMM|nr:MULTISPECIES: 3-ketoacyl-ACP reductase FabG2 [Pseudoalteromonas]MCF2860610.1 3-ketoacyl-ACP reductase FabG2 [Pseudoalteromonas sp. CNAT2-18]MCG7556479.1 3-ketoacyl-ACP reductase FabG2 [Pseudoalteromonas sp. CNAT2-18.1]MCG7565680.1 3-ketoacyl-ACP reductase FabG2 [Pseudoalteromonas sp. CnMc7-15]MCG7569300.1 3-ketoacyl-ACP reductase FabG2 [Pseudoalteromonas sp. CNC9-20]QFU06667.1 3-oxoacyl-[acyl-carrier-protein] reductase FabG [Pseudoalteromonas sp. THAF3]|tara:strand:+ start:56463 stop:57188 length:726 start_codon:yes stop_codon:yes gene_type:complete
MSRAILVTGSSRGIGKAIALALAEQGFDIILHCRTQREQAQKVSEQIQAMGRSARVLCFDVTDRDSARQSIEQDIAEHGAYYGVVCNAGVTRDTAFPAMTDDEWDTVISTGLDGFYNVVRPAVMPMVSARQGGRIITLASVSGIAGNRGQVNYSAAKAGIIGATKALALELAKRKITVNCVAPGLIATEMTEQLDTKELLKHVPMRRMGNVEEVAATVSFLASDPAAYITRQVISVNGGLV